MDPISLENPMLSEDFSSETNFADVEDRSCLFILQNLCCNPKYIRHRIFKENPRCRIEKTPLSTTFGCARLGPSVPDRPAKLDYTFYSNKKLSIFPNKIFSKRTPVEGFTDSETDDSTISSGMYEYMDFIPEPTTFRGLRIGLIYDIS